MKKCRKVLIVFLFSLSVLITGCVGGGSENQGAANENRGIVNGNMKAVVEQRARPNVDAIGRMIYGANVSLKEGNWEQATAALEEALKQAEQGKNESNIAALKPHFEEMESMIREALASVRAKEPGAASQVERLEQAATAFNMRVQQMYQ